MFIILQGLKLSGFCRLQGCPPSAVHKPFTKLGKYRALLILHNFTTVNAMNGDEILHYSRGIHFFEKSRSTLCSIWVAFLLGHILVGFHLKLNILEHQSIFIIFRKCMKEKCITTGMGCYLFPYFSLSFYMFRKQELS